MDEVLGSTGLEVDGQEPQALLEGSTGLEDVVGHEAHSLLDADDVVAVASTGLELVEGQIPQLLSMVELVEPDGPPEWGWVDVELVVVSKGPPGWK